MPTTISALANAFSSYALRFEVLLVDDHSGDGTDQLEWGAVGANGCTHYIPLLRGAGKGAAVRRGIETASGSIIVLMDADLPVDLADMRRAIRLILAGDADLVIGDRSAAGSEVVGQAGLNRRIASRAFNLAAQALAVRGYRDTQCPLKVFGPSGVAAVAESLTLSSFALDVEIIVLAELANLTILRIPVRWVDKRAAWGSFRTIYIVSRCIFDVIRSRWRHRQGS